jgi:hypothetical protein
MTDVERLKYLKLALRVVAVVAIFGLYPLSVLWPSGWPWTSGRSEYLEMIIAIYATLGAFLIAAGEPSLWVQAPVDFVRYAPQDARVALASLTRTDIGASIAP